MNYAQINAYDIANGPGVRVSIFVSGCSFHCDGCHNMEAWDYEYGDEYTSETEKKIITLLDDENISGLSILGGEPLDSKNFETVDSLIKAVRAKFKDSKDIWLWTGFTIDTINKIEPLKEVISNVDYVIEGPFIMELQNWKLKYRGSKNQHVYDVKQETFVLIDDED